MADSKERPVSQSELIVGVQAIADVIGWMVEASVNCLQMLRPHLCRQVLQVAIIVVGELFTKPLHPVGAVRLEVRLRQALDREKIVVAGDHDVACLLRDADRSARVRRADEIAQAPDLVAPGLAQRNGSGQQRRWISMRVGEKADERYCPSFSCSAFASAAFFWMKRPTSSRVFRVSLFIALSSASAMV